MKNVIIKTGIIIPVAAIDNGFEPDYFLKYIREKTDKEIIRTLDLIQPQFENTSYNYYEIFFNGNQELNIPRWSGYLLGFYLINRYAIDHKLESSDLFAKKYSDFK